MGGSQGGVALWCGYVNFSRRRGSPRDTPFYFIAKRRNMDHIKFCGVVLETFPSINGMMDLYYRDGHIYYERANIVGGTTRWGLCCAYDQIDIDSAGMKLKKQESGCTSSPVSARLCGHVFEEEVYHLHRFFRAVRIALSVLKAKGLYREVKKPDVLMVMRKMQRVYCQSGVHDLEVFYKQREGAVKYIRRHDKPWRISLSADMEYSQEVTRESGFQDVMEKIKEDYQKNRKYLFDSAPFITYEENSNTAIIRDHLIDEALDLGSEFVALEFLVRGSDGTVAKIKIGPGPHF